MAEDTPLLDTLALMTAASVDACNLEDRELMLARIAALAAVGAPLRRTCSTPAPRSMSASRSRTSRVCSSPSRRSSGRPGW